MQGEKLILDTLFQMKMERYEQMEYGPEKIAFVEEAIREADEMKDDYARMSWRIQYINDQYYHGNMIKCIPVIDELCNIFQKNPKACERFNGDTLSEELVILAMEFGVEASWRIPQVSMQQLDFLLETYCKITKKYGIAYRNYLWQRVQQWKYADIEKAKQYLNEIKAGVPSYDWDCKACEDVMTAEIYLLAGKTKEADEIAVPYLKKQVYKVCEDTMPRLWSLYLQEALREGENERALNYAMRIYRRRKKGKGNGELGYLGQALRCISLNNTDCACSLFVKYMPWTIDMGDENALFQFYTGAYVLFRELSKEKSTVKMELPKQWELWREDNNYNTHELKESFYALALKIAQAFDVRNGSDYYKNDLMRF